MAALLFIGALLWAKVDASRELARPADDIRFTTGGHVTHRRDFLRMLAAGATAGSVTCRGGSHPSAAGQTPPAAAPGQHRRTPGQGHRRARALRDPGRRRRRRHTAGRTRRCGGEQPPRAGPSRGDGSAGRRRPGPDHQRILVVCGRSRPGRPDRAGAERRPRPVGGGAPGPLRGDGVGGAAASGAGGRAARGRRQAPGHARRLDWWPRERRGPVAAQVRSVLGQGRRARRAGRDAPRGRREHPQGGSAPRPRRSRQHHRQPARDDLLPVAPDLRRGARSVPRPPRLRRARRRLPAVVSGTHGGRVHGTAERGVCQQDSRRAPTSSRRSTSTRWSSRRKDYGIWSRRSASARSCTAPTCRSTGQSPSIWCSTRRSSATTRRRRFWAGTRPGLRL